MITSTHCARAKVRACRCRTVPSNSLSGNLMLHHRMNGFFLQQYIHVSTTIAVYLSVISWAQCRTSLLFWRRLLSSTSKRQHGNAFPPLPAACLRPSFLPPQEPQQPLPSTVESFGDCGVKMRRSGWRGLKRRPWQDDTSLLAPCTEALNLLACRYGSTSPSSAHASQPPR